MKVYRTVIGMDIEPPCHVTGTDDLADIYGSLIDWTVAHGIWLAAQHHAVAVLAHQPAVLIIRQGARRKATVDDGQDTVFGGQAHNRGKGTDPHAGRQRCFDFSNVMVGATEVVGHSHRGLAGGVVGACRWLRARGAAPSDAGHKQIDRRDTDSDAQGC